jgi:uncharacterized protein with gpF-like domain
MSDIETDLPKVKKPVVKTKAEKPSKKDAKKDAKAATSKPSKKDAKAAKAKAEKPSKKEAKAAKKDSKKGAKVAAKTSKKEAKATKPAKAAKTKVAQISVDAISANIANYMAGAKQDSAKVEYDSAKSVIDGLSYKASSILLRAYSDKNLSAITHGDSAVAKAAKSVLAKNAAAIRSEATAKHVKKFAGQIVKAAKAAESGKLTAADYRGVVFDV